MSSNSYSAKNVIDYDALIARLRKAEEYARGWGPDNIAREAVDAIEHAMTEVYALRAELIASEFRSRQEIPAELFSGHEIYVELGINSTLNATDVSNVLDAVVRLIRKNRRIATVGQIKEDSHEQG